MLTMLVVDDEHYALKGITEGVDWGDLPIGKILEAENVEAAKRLMGAGSIDLVISDIEMPGENGIELLRYIREVSPQTLTVFLTGHARFEFAQEALHYGCFDYLLKPVDHDVLKQIVHRAILEIERRQSQQQFEDTLEIYRRQWTNQLHILVERFWQEVLAWRVPISAERLNREFELYDIPLYADSFVLPVLLSIEKWDVELDARDESIMEYALRKAAEEIVIEGQSGTVLQDRGELNIALLYANGQQEIDRDGLSDRCRRYVKACQDYFHCGVSCYVGEAVHIGELAKALDKLQQMERANVAHAQSVLDISTDWEEMPTGGGLALPPFVEWGMMLDSGNLEKLSQAVEETIRRFHEEVASREQRELFYFGFINMLFQSAYRKGLSVYEFVTMQELNEGLTMRSSEQMQAWAKNLMQKAGQSYQDRQRDSSAVIAKIQAFIQDNLHKEISRDEIAGAVFRNPAYLSRLFRKETGLSLSDYIAHIKIERAKRLLTETNDKVSNIAADLGYMHFSYFTKLFKKITGLTPQDYRKKHQTL